MDHILTSRLYGSNIVYDFYLDNEYRLVNSSQKKEIWKNKVGYNQSPRNLA